MTVIRFKRMSSAQWTKYDLVLDSGEPGVETDTRRFKIGDGYSNWSELEYYPLQRDLPPLIAEAIADLEQIVGPPGPPAFFLDGVGAKLEAVSNGDGTHRLVVTTPWPS